jgi:hypothetical protein
MQSINWLAVEKKYQIEALSRKSKCRREGGIADGVAVVVATDTRESHSGRRTAGCMEELTLVDLGVKMSSKQRRF